MAGQTRIYSPAVVNRPSISFDAVGVHFSEWLMMDERPLGFMRRVIVLLTAVLFVATSMAGCLETFASNSAPVAVINVSPAGTVKVGDTVTFDASSSYDPDVADTLKFSWDFGDGNVVTIGNPGQNKEVEHVYKTENPSGYTVTLEVSDNELVATTTTIVKVAGADAVLPTASVITYKDNDCTGEDPPAGSNFILAWICEEEMETSDDTVDTKTTIQLDGSDSSAGDNYNVVNVTVWVKPAQGGEAETANIQLIGISQGNTTKSDTAVLSLTRTFGLVLSVTPQGSSGIFVNKQAGESFNIDMLIESSVDEDHTILLDVEDLPSGWSHNFKDETGASVTEISLAGGESEALDLLITVGSQASYSEEGYSFKAVSTALTDSNLVGRQPIDVFLKLTEGFDASSLKFKHVMGPGDSYIFQLNIENKANGDDTFTLTAPSVPSGWRVLFLEGQIQPVSAGRSITIPIQITVDDEARDGDKEIIQISILSELSNQVQQKSFVVEVEQGFTDKLVTTFSDMWYIFAFLGLILAVGFATYSRREEDDWEYDDEEVEDSGGLAYSALPTENQSDDDWDDWN